jgi:C-5 cytosine-specific DNA methylase
MILAIKRRLVHIDAPVDSKLKAASFFGGIGGFDLAFQEEGCQIVFQCELDKFCKSIGQMSNV